MMDGSGMRDDSGPISSLDRGTMQVATLIGMPESDPYISDFLFIPRELGELRQRLRAFGELSRWMGGEVPDVAPVGARMGTSTARRWF